MNKRSTTEKDIILRERDKNRERDREREKKVVKNQYGCQMACVYRNEASALFHQQQVV